MGRTPSPHPTRLACRSLLIAATVLILVAQPVIADDARARRVHVDRSMKGMVVCNSALASRVGAQVLAEGGTAVDAAVATAFAMAVTWPEAGNIGGGGFMLVHPIKGKPKCIDYREKAPGKAHLRMFSADSSTYHPLAVGVPGTVAGMSLAHQEYGRLKWERLVRPSVELARQGFAVDAFLAQSINSIITRAGSDPRYAELRRVYGRADNESWTAGQKLVLPDLAKTLEQIAEHGADGFYRGPVAKLLVAEMKRGGGWISASDLAAYQAKIREPVHGVYRGWDIYGAPPPASGGLCSILMMHMLEPMKLRQYDRFSAETLHLTAEAMRRAFLQRALHLADPDFSEIPNHLDDKPFAHRLASDMRPTRATPSESLAAEIRIADESPETTHFSVVDAHGNAVSNTYTLEASWGSRVVVQGAGFVLNNEMGDFNWLPGVTNRRGRIGTLANQIAPHKRMLSSQSPTIVSRNGKPMLVTGSPGGRTIINTVVNILLNVLEFEMPIEQAVTIRRTHHQWLPDQLVIEAGDDPKLVETVRRLKKMGHDVRSRSSQGAAHSIWIDPKTGQQVGVADWRRGGLAAGVKSIGKPANASRPE